MLAPLLAGGAGSSANLTPTTLSQRRRVFHVRVLDRQRWEEVGFVRGGLPQHRCTPTPPTLSTLPNSLPSAQGSLSFWSVRACPTAQRGPGVQLFVCDVPARSPTHTCSSAAAGHRQVRVPPKQTASAAHPPARPPAREHNAHPSGGSAARNRRAVRPPALLIHTEGIALPGHVNVGDRSPSPLQSPTEQEHRIFRRLLRF